MGCFGTVLFAGDSCACAPLMRSQTPVGAIRGPKPPLYVPMCGSRETTARFQRSTGAEGAAKLVVNAAEAARVREIFGLYLKHGSLLPVVEELARREDQ